MLACCLQAQTVVWMGTVGDWLTPANWNNGVPIGASAVRIDNGGTATLAGSGVASSLMIGDANMGSLSITGGSLTTSGANLGYGAGSIGSVAVSGGTWTNNSNLYVGGFGTGNLTISGTGAVTSNGTVIGVREGSHGIVAVSGGSWTEHIAIELGFGVIGTTDVNGNPVAVGNGALNVSGGTVAAPYISIAGSPGSTGSMTVSGGSIVLSGDEVIRHANGTETRIPSHLSVGSLGTGTLDITGGSVADVEGRIGINGVGIAVVSGGSWINSSFLSVGGGKYAGGTGTLTISDTGLVSAQTVILAVGPTVSPTSSRGTINLNGISGSRGILSTGQITEGDGTGGGAVNFNGGILRMTADQAALFSNFETGDIQFLSGGAFIDTNGHAVGISQVLQGAGGLAKQGGGTLTLEAINTYSGATTVEGGTLRLGIARAIENSTLNYVAGGGLFDFGTFSLVTLGGLSGSKDLALINANSNTVSLSVGNNNTDTTYAGSLGGGGVLNKIGSGTLKLTGINTFTGGTTVKEGTLEVTAGSITHAANAVVAGANPGDNGTLLISGGSVASSYGSVGVFGGATGTATVSAGTWANDSMLIVGDAGTGTLTVSGEGLVTAPTVQLGTYASGQGALNLNGNSSQRGVLATNQVTEGAGTGAINFNGGIFRATADNTALFSSFEAGDVQLLAGGGFLNTNGFEIGLALALQGTGGLTKLGPGTLTLTGANTYTGTTTVAGGTLVLGANATLANAGQVQVDNGGTLSVTSVGATLNYLATVAGTLDIRGGGTSTGAINLAGGSVVFNGLGETFTVANAATGLTGAGGLNFASGTTVLNYGVTAAPVTINQSLSFTGGTLELPGATSLRTSSLVLGGRYFEITGLVASVGSTPNLPTTVLAGGNFGWGAGTVRNTLTLEAGVTPTLVRSGDINLDGTLINRTTNLRFEAGFNTVTQSVASSDAGGSTRFFTASLTEGSFGGTGTLRNEGTLAVDLSGLRGRTYDYFGISTSEFSGLSWTPGIENLGTATLGGNSAVGPSFATLTSGGTFTGPITNSGNLTIFGRIGLSNLTQTAGTTTLPNNPTVAGGVWNVGTGSTLTAPNGAYLSVNLTNSGTLDFGAGTTVGTLQNQAGGTVRVAGLLATQPAFLTGNAGTIILDGPAAGLRTIGTTVIDGRFLPGDSLALGSIAGGTLELRNGANLTLANGFAGPADLRVGNGSTLTISGGIVGGPGSFSILSGGVANNTGGERWGARPVSNAGTFNVTGRMNLSDGTALTFNNLAGGVVNLTGTSAMFASGGNGQSVVLTNAVGGTITKSGSATTYDVGFGNVSIVNHGLIEQASDAGWLLLSNLTNDGMLRAAAGTDLYVANSTLLVGTVLDGAGTFHFGGGTTTLSAGLSLSARNLRLDGGIVNGPGAITLRSGDVMHFTSGQFNGTGGLAILSGGSFTNNGGGSWGGRPVTNAGTFNATGQISAIDGSALVFDNLAGGVVNLTGNNQFIAAGGNGQSAVLTNAVGGTITKSGSTSAYNLGVGNVSIVNHGLIEQASDAGWLRLNNLTNDATLRAVAGTDLYVANSTLLAGTVLDGAGAFHFGDGTTTLGAGSSISGKDLRLDGGIVNGPGAITVRSGDGMRFTGGQLNGAGALAIYSGGTFENNGGGSWGARPVSNAGTFNVTGRMNLSDGTALTFDNLAGGVVNLTGTSAMFASGGNGQSVVLTNGAGATIRKNGTTDYALILGAGTFVNQGLVEVKSGILRAIVALTDGELGEGTWSVTEGARLILNGDASISKNAASVSLTGPGAEFRGLAGLTSNTGSLQLFGGPAFSTSAAFVNSGVLTVGGGSSVVTSGKFTNSGNLVFGSGGSFSTSATFENSGMLNFASGSSFSTSATFNNGGLLNMDGNFGGTGTLINTGTIGGRGTFGALTTVASGGTLAPGNSPGTLTFGAGLTLQAGSVLDFQLGTTSDRIVVSGGLLTGPTTGKVTLNISNSGGFFAGAYTLINYATASGTVSFDATDFSLGSTISGFSYGLALRGGSLELTASAIPEPSTYAAILGAVVLGLAWWRRGGRRAR